MTSGWTNGRLPNQKIILNYEGIDYDVEYKQNRNKEFILRLMGLCKSLEDPSKLIPCGTKNPRTGERLHYPPITIKELTAGVPQELSDEIRDIDFDSDRNLALRYRET